MEDFLILLDVNGIFGYKSEERIYEGDVIQCANYTFVLYPEVRNFIETLRERYTVGIFSSTRFTNIANVLGHIDPNFRKTFTPLMDRVMTSFDPDSNDEITTVKYLETFWSNPIHNAKRKWSAENTLLIDDSTQKVRFNFEKNILLVKEFSGYETLLDQIEEKISLL